MPSPSSPSVPMTDADKIEAAALVLSLPEWWTQGALARSRSGHKVSYGDRSASCFCAAGALYAAGVSDRTMYLLLEKKKGLLGVWNDTPGRTNTEVASFLFDCADELRAKERG